MKLTHTRLVTKDVPALARFYQEITGILPVGSGDYTELRTSCGALVIISQRTVELLESGATGAEEIQPSIVEVEVEDVDKERTRLHELGRECVAILANQRWGNRSILIRDPDGNLINFFASLHRTEIETKQSRSKL